MKAEKPNVATAPKTTTFQVRINPDVKAYVEMIYANSGMTLTDAFNLFIQQSINVEGLPFIVTQNSKETMREQALLRLLMELSLGEESAKSEGWISEDAIAKKFGVKL